jgi:hypothetical protein
MNRHAITHLHPFNLFYKVREMRKGVASTGIVAAIIVTLAIVSVANASVLQGVEADGTPGGGAVTGLAIAYQFSVTESDGITATSLGYYNGWNPSGGLASDETVGLFSLSDLNADGSTTSNLLGSATVLAGTVDPFSGGFRFASLSTPIYLLPGDYGVVAYAVGSNGDHYGDSTTPVTGPGTAIATDTYQSVSFPSYPLGGTGDPAYHAAASFLYEPGDVVPEPTSLGLLALGGVWMLGRRRGRAMRKR